MLLICSILQHHVIVMRISCDSYIHYVYYLLSDANVQCMLS